MKLKALNVALYTISAILLSFALRLILLPHMTTLLENRFYGFVAGSVMVVIGGAILWRHRFSELRWDLITVVKILLPSICVGLGAIILLSALYA